MSPRSVSYQIGNYLIFNRASICQNGKSWNKTQDQDKATILSLFTTKRIKRAAGYVLLESASGAIRCLPSAHKLLAIQKMLSSKACHGSAHSHDKTLIKCFWWRVDGSVWSIEMMFLTLENSYNPFGGSIGHLLSKLRVWSCFSALRIIFWIIGSI